VRSVFCLSVIATLIAFLMSACDPSGGGALPHLDGPHKRGLAENPKRTLMGMRPIGGHWICFRSTSIGGDEWISDRAHDKAAVKCVRRDEGSVPVSETDYYRSGRRYLTEEGSEADEELRVSCDWTTGEISIAYLGDERGIEKPIKLLPAFSPQTKAAYLDLVASVVAKWGIAPSAQSTKPAMPSPSKP
jgi:hypothetical protein